MTKFLSNESSLREYPSNMNRLRIGLSIRKAIWAVVVTTFVIVSLLIASR